MQPGTGQIMAIAEDRKYGTKHGQTEINYAVNTTYGGSAGVQTGSSSKLFTLITALKQGKPFGFQLSVPGSTTVTGYTNCQGGPAGVYQGMPGAYNVTNAEGPQSASTQSLYTGTTQSVNVFYAELEQQVGLCNVVHTAADLGLTRADGTSLFSRDGSQDSADNIPSFTLGSVNVSPLSMAAAYATVAARGMYCSPVAIGKITDSAGQNLPVPSANCHRALSSDVADAVNYILQGVLTSRHGVEPRRPGRPRGGRQDRYLQRGRRRRHPVRRLRRLHAQPGRLRLGVQPGFPDRRHDDRPERLLPPGERQPGMPGRDVRGERARLHLAHDVRQRRPRPGDLLRARPCGQPVQQHGQRSGRHPAADEEEEAGRRGWPRRRRRRRRQRRTAAVAAAAVAVAAAATAAATAAAADGSGR